MLVFNYTLNICSAVGIRVAPITTSFQTLPLPRPPSTPSRHRFSIPRNFLPCLHPTPTFIAFHVFFSFPPFFFLFFPPSPQGERPLFQITRRKLVYRSLGGLGPVVFLFSFFSFFQEETEDTVGLFGSLTRTFPRPRGTGLIMTGEGRGLKHRHPKIRHNVSFIGKVRRELCHDIQSSTSAISTSHLLLHYRINYPEINDIVLLKMINSFLVTRFFW